MNYEPLMAAVVQAILFLELADERTIDADAAVTVMEEIAAALQQLAPSEKQHFLDYLQRRAQGSGSDPQDVLKCIGYLPESLGLLPE